jgi:ABC-type Mn2+/Zn2+ transport system ATPase subunit
MQPIISVRNLSKTYTSGFQALKGINLEIRRGEIFALLGPNGAVMMSSLPTARLDRRSVSSRKN